MQASVTQENRTFEFFSRYLPFATPATTTDRMPVCKSVLTPPACITTSTFCCTCEPLAWTALLWTS